MTQAASPDPRRTQAPNRLAPERVPGGEASARSLLKGDLPDEVLKRYLIERPGWGPDRFYRDHRSAGPTFTDQGRSLRADQAYPDTISTLLKIARHRGWSRLRVQGDEAFRREVWIQARAQGLEVSGYRPRDRDRQAAGLPRDTETAVERLRRASALVRHIVADPAAQARLLDHARRLSVGRELGSDRRKDRQRR